MTNETTNEISLVGHCYHSFKIKDDGCRVVEWQGTILARIEPGVYLVETYSWLSGGAYNRVLVTIDEMRDWWFYNDPEWMNDTYEHDLSIRGDTHRREHERQA